MALFYDGFDINDIDERRCELSKTVQYEIRRTNNIVRLSNGGLLSGYCICLSLLYNGSAFALCSVIKISYYCEEPLNWQKGLCIMSIIKTKQDKMRKKLN